MSRPVTIEEMLEALKEKYKTSHFFKIENFSLIRKQISRVESSAFISMVTNGRKLLVYSNGYGGGKNHVAIVVEKQASINVNLQIELFVINQLQPTWHSKGTMALPSDLKWKGDSDLITHADLETKGYHIGDCCIFGVRFIGIQPAESGTAECFDLIEKPLNHKVTWMMTKFSSLEPENVHSSNEFVVGNRKWRIQVHPRGFKEGKDKSFSVYLSGEGFINNVPRSNTFAIFKLRVLDQVNRDHLEKTYSGWLGEEPDVNHGFADFMPLKSLDKPYLVNDKFYVGVEFEVISVTNSC
ncbi:unnamed protein product [Thlaspi arvense]|uniref:MATH domain-containing protein n=1 Tax=Thlaspi arvense TaxID=13288 RepID=A0AAU9SLF4_THLAR|nr:unnamed protein product [Thlaspi arvense]